MEFNKNKVLALIIAIVVSQIVAAITYYLLDLNFFIPLLIGSLVSFIFGFKGKDQESKL